MKRTPLAFALVALLLTGFVYAASPNVVISQVYGGGGNAGATYKNDFIELHNRGTAAVSVSGWSVQYASSSGTSWAVTNLAGSIPAGGYYLVQEAAGSGGTTSLPAPDASGSIAMSATSGKVALVNATTAISGSGCPFAASIIDFVGFGTSANCSEGAATTPTLTNTTAALRAANGCTDTDNNSADFAAGAPTPRNSGSPVDMCGVVVNNPPTITAPANPIVTVLQNAAPFTVSLSGSDDRGMYKWSATAGAGVQSVTVTGGQDTANGTYTVALVTNYTGTATFTASLSDTVNAAVTQSVNITVNAVAVDNPPAITSPANPIATVTRDAAPLTVTVSGSDDHNIFNWSATTGTGVSAVSVTGGQGTSTATFTVTLLSGFTGTATFTASLSDNVNAAATTAVNIAVNPPALPPGTIVISQFYGGGGNAGSTLKNDFIELFNRSNNPVSVDGWSVQHFSSSNPTWFATPLSGVIQPHSYYLVQEAAGTTPGGGTVPLPTPDATGDIGVSSTAGTVALSTSTTLLPAGICSTRSDVIDFIGYGSGSSCSGRVAIGPALSNTVGASRTLGGCTYTNSATDFAVGPPAPRNSATPANDCSTAVDPTTPHVMISQLYGGGGNSVATYSNDFVELYNPTDVDVPLDGWSIQYASSTGSGWGSNSQPLGGSIPSHGYLLIELAAGATPSTPLPPPRIIGDINMSASSGKLALVNRFEPLSGNCPIGDPSLVDFIGYGSADCFEGGLAAPSLTSNGQSLVRSTNSDTNQNSVDFSRLTPPNPRGTGELVELPPLVSSFDPQPADAPYDASITLNFSEPVNVADGWFNISCTSTGVHTDVEVASAFGGRTWIITPNVTFFPGETCTVHIFKSFVTDQDTNDGPSTDNLPTDFVWSFTIATGTPVETSDVHLTMGNPSDAIPSFALPNNYLMEKPEYALSYNRDRGTANWVSWHLANEWTITGNRTDTFRPDPALPPTWYRVLQTDYSGSGFDRGHMCPSADRNISIPINQATFLMTNMVPQSPDNNQGPWEQFETYLRTLLPANEIYIVSGPLGEGGTGSNGFATRVANGQVTVPESTWKVALVLPKMSGDDVARVTPSTRTIAIRIQNIQGIKDNDWHQYLTTVRTVEQLTGYNFFSNVPAIIQNSIERGTDGVNPPGVDDESLTTSEDTANVVTLNAVSPDTGATFTYTVGNPAHGSVTPSSPAGTYTYTPAPDFNGNDSFTFSVSDGHFDSNTSTVTVHVSEVNDAPIAADDVGNVEAGSTLSIPVSALTSNDSPGPANESSQTLTVTAVTSTAATHGNVSLAGGQVTYTPVIPYAGPASFTYTVCDNGTTNGNPDSKCATGTVRVNVNDSTPPAISTVMPSVTQLWPPNHKMVDVAVAYGASDLGDSTPACSLQVSSNEPINGTGDGDTAPDWQIVDGHYVRLRAERAGTGSGRIYTITATCADATGNAAQRSATVVVPKNQK